MFHPFIIWLSSFSNIEFCKAQICFLFMLLPFEYICHWEVLENVFVYFFSLQREFTVKLEFITALYLCKLEIPRFQIQ